METLQKRLHSLCIKGEISVTGVTQVVALEEREVRLTVGEKSLILTGNGFNAEKLSLDEGVLVLSGEVTMAKYAAKTEAKSLLKRLFK